MRKRARIDANQPEIVAALRQAGAFVQSLATVGDGCPDLLVAFRGRWYVMEVKTEKGGLTADEARWHGEAWDASARVTIPRSVVDALRAIGAM